jgi:hypothetical protein
MSLEFALREEIDAFIIDWAVITIRIGDMHKNILNIGYINELLKEWE